MKKIGLLCLALVLALGALGVGYASWTDTITISGTNSTISVDFDFGTLANGTDVVTVTVTVRDTANRPVAGQTVSLAATGQGNTLTQPAATTDVNGEATGTLATTVAEIKTLSAIVNPGTATERRLDPFSDGNVLVRGDVLRLQTGGGGGWGHPYDRPPAQVLADVLGGFVSQGAAKSEYGVVLSEDGRSVNEPATAALRADRPAVGGLFHRGRYLDELE